MYSLDDDDDDDIPTPICPEACRSCYCYLQGKQYHKGRVKTLVDPELFDHQSESLILQKKRKVPF
jgi:hypothetical protein